MGSLSVEFLLRELGIALFFVDFAIVFALLALACCCHHGGCWMQLGHSRREARGAWKV